MVASFLLCYWRRYSEILSDLPWISQGSQEQSLKAVPGRFRHLHKQTQEVQRALFPVIKVKDFLSHSDLAVRATPGWRLVLMGAFKAE